MAGRPPPAPTRRVGSGPVYELAAGRHGNFGRNVLRGPGFVNWQFAAFKRTKITESQNLEFRAESSISSIRPSFETR